MPSLNTYWSLLETLFPGDTQITGALQKDLPQSSRRRQELTQEILSEWCAMQKMPLALLLAEAVEQKAHTALWQEEVYPALARITSSGILPLMKHRSRLVSVEEWCALGHETTLLNIRMQRGWSRKEREASVQGYLKLVQVLHQLSWGLIPNAEDRVLARAEFKAIPWHTFLEFLAHLSERDALIAELLYSGAPSVEAVLQLTVQDIDVQQSRITLDGHSLTMPAHLCHLLQDFARRESRGHPRLFSTSSGSSVSRAHLNHAFARASTSSDPITISRLTQ